MDRVHNVCLHNHERSERQGIPVTVPSQPFDPGEHMRTSLVIMTCALWEILSPLGKSSLPLIRAESFVSLTGFLC